MRLEIDPHASAAYLRLAAGDVVRSITVAPGVVVDLGAGGEAVGVELLGVSCRSAAGEAVIEVAVATGEKSAAHLELERRLAEALAVEQARDA